MNHLKEANMDDSGFKDYNHELASGTGHRKLLSYDTGQLVLSCRQ